ncbi:hypothetical protein GGI59_000678 [Rhizobium lentis]|uniref:Uncharacterized protein n=1 Tax=Rhizobium lentis TaxID=1138194 RepID=A0A7W8UJ98_9HYPH|nr:hypothetical protein [Rhizobium lentis]MBB5548521.1 hypothetical protein [Rhizobium lentis]MBB5559051.1 hypothetical protein [Rhizobium lentis]MBB5565426.1 hypothetical protein [Rhizobium lentis]
MENMLPPLPSICLEEGTRPDEIGLWEVPESLLLPASGEKVAGRKDEGL